MQFCKGIQVAALLAALSTVGLAAPVVEGHSLAARDNSYDVNSYSGYSDKDDHPYSSKCDAAHTIGADSVWKSFRYKKHDILVIYFNQDIFTYGSNGKWYRFLTATNRFSLCKEDEWDFSHVKLQNHGFYSTAYDDGYGTDGHDGYGTDGHDGYGTDGHDGYGTDGHDGYGTDQDDGHHTSGYDSDKIYYGKDILTYLSKVDIVNYRRKVAKSKRISVKWVSTKFGNHDIEGYTYGGKQVVWVKHKGVFFPIVYFPGHGWGYDEHYDFYPSTWCKKFVDISYLNDPKIYVKGNGYNSGSDYDSEDDHDYSDNDSGKVYGRDISYYFNHLQYDEKVHAAFFYHNKFQVFVSDEGLFYYKDGQCTPYTGLKFDRSYTKNAIFLKFLARYPNAYTTRSKWSFGIAKNSGYGSHDSHDSDESDCSDSEGGYSSGYDPKGKGGYGKGGYGDDSKGKGGYGDDSKGKGGYGDDSKDSY